jgi:hypothetical protein
MKNKDSLKSGELYQTLYSFTYTQDKNKIETKIGSNVLVVYIGNNEFLYKKNVCKLYFLTPTTSTIRYGGHRIYNNVNMNVNFITETYNIFVLKRI